MKARVFRDPVHGLIELRGEDAALGQVLDTGALQRLRRIRQVGFASLVYPGAEHSRFGHSLGAFHVAGRVAEQLRLAPQVARDVKAAALLHDVGHGPFSHAWEEALGGDGHEAWGRRIIAGDDELRAALAQVAPDLPAAMDRFFGGDYLPGFARKLVSSQLDVDRMDYLRRDAHFTGVGYAAYDLDWLVHALRVEKVRRGADPEDLVVDYRRGMHAVDQYLAGRFYMYAQVYYHKTVRAAEWMFLRAMSRFGELARAGRPAVGLPAAARLACGETVSVGEYLALDDARVLCALEDWARDRRAAAGDEVLADLAARLHARRLFKTVELGDDPAVADRLAPRFDEAARSLLGERAGYYWAVDTAQRLGYDPRPGEELFVVGHPRHGTADLGRLLEELPGGRRAFTIRVICAPELHERFLAVAAAR